MPIFTPSLAVPLASLPPPAGTGWLPIAACLPFVLILACIAILPLVPRAHAFWGKNQNQWLVSGGLGLLAAGACLVMGSGPALLGHTAMEYAAFVCMLAALYAASGGIHVTGAFAGFPQTNLLLLAIGAVLSSLIGTTGASMLLLRPLLRANVDRKHKTHIFVFFIFVVSNCGGLLTPMGDPPLYLGFLRGVPFFWTTLHLWPAWLLANGLLLGAFLVIDIRLFTKEALETKGKMLAEVAQVAHKLHVRGWQNVAFLLAVPLVMAVCGAWLQPWLGTLVGHETADLLSKAAQVFLFCGIAFASAKTTPKMLHHETNFSWHPIKEVAALFAGIFLAMMPVAMLFEARSDALPLSAAWHYYFVTGGLSSVLDNAPTYATLGQLAAVKAQVGTLGDLAGKDPLMLAAISCGAVLFGAMTYIGNGPNLMVKSICEHHHVKMPSFLNYVVLSTLILLPVLGVVALVFFRP